MLEDVSDFHPECHVFRIQTYEHEGEWGKAVGSYDLELSEPASASTQLGLLQVSLKTISLPTSLVEFIHLMLHAMRRPVAGSGVGAFNSLCQRRLQ